MARPGLIAGLGRALRVALVACVLTLPWAAQAQDRPSSPILTIDQEALFERSAFGRRLQAELSAAAAALAAENRSYEAELAEEERQLTEKRATMEPAAFRELAAAFDAKVVEVRREQDQKGRDIARRPDEARQRFFRAVIPVLTEIVRERGAVAILDARAILISAETIDVTDEAVRRIDATLGDGSGVVAPDAPESPETPENNP